MVVAYFLEFFGCCAFNAWKILTVYPDEDMAQLTFRRLVAVHFIHSTTTLSNLLGRHSALLNNPRPGPVHLLIRNENRRRCRACQSQTIFMCNLCNI
jgi:hypothetical protein